MDPLFLSRLQFAVATYFHFLFVPLTLGLSILLAIMETTYIMTRNEEYKKMTQFWGKIFVVNFVVGVATGLTLEFQFGTNWSRYSRYVGDIFGSLLAIEATVAFFLESTFIAVWAFGWNKLSPKMHCATIWIVAFASNLSAVWILIANSWMQSPVGFVMENGRPVLSSFFEIVTQKYAILTILHTLSASYVVTGFFVLGVSAYHILKKQFLPVFNKSFKIGLLFAAVFTFFVVAEGHMHASDLVEKQPAKLASLESHWVTRSNAPIYILAHPDENNGRNLFEFGKIPGALSLLALHTPNATVKGLRDIPREDRPPVAITFHSFRLMVGLGMLFLLAVVIGLIRLKKIETQKIYLKALLFGIPLPYLACAAGWTVTEVGRQPWIVYGLMRTKDSLSPLATSQVAISLCAFIILYSIIGITAYTVIAQIVRKGPPPSVHFNSSGKEG